MSNKQDIYKLIIIERPQIKNYINNKNKFLYSN